MDLTRSLGADQFGSGFTFVRADIKGNIDRLNRAYQKDPEKFKGLFEIVLDEVVRGQDGLRDSDTKGLLWLKRYFLKSIYGHGLLEICNTMMDEQSLLAVYYRSDAKVWMLKLGLIRYALLLA